MLDAAWVEQVGIAERVHRRHEGIDARIVTRSKQRVPERLEVREKLADECEAGRCTPPIVARFGVLGFAGERAHDLREHPYVAAQSLARLALDDFSVEYPVLAQTDAERLPEKQ